MRSVEAEKAKETKLLARYQKQRSWKPYVGYSVVIVILIILAAAVDEMCSAISGDMQSAILTDFYGNLTGADYSKAIGQFTLITTLASISSLISPFYKVLADKLGRKLFLWLNVLGMAIGLGVCVWSPNIIVYLVGFFIMSFFVTHDMQVVYVFEVAPAKKRASLYGFTKCIGTLCIVLIPLLRMAFLNDADPTAWRKVFLVPAILAVVIAVLLAVFSKETNVFLDNRIAYLSRPYEERQEEILAAKAKGKDKNNSEHKTGVFPAIKYIYSHHDLKWVAITQIAVGFGFMAMSNYYTGILGGFSWNETDISKVLLLHSTIYALSMLVAGLLADKFGRKKVIIGCLSIMLPCFTLYVVGAKFFWNAYLLGVIMSLYRSGLYITYDYLTLMASEMSPTEIRGSVMGGQSLMSYLAVALGFGIDVVLLETSGLLTGYACLIVGIPFGIISLVLSIFFLKESKGVDMEAIH